MLDEGHAATIDGGGTHEPVTLVLTEHIDRSECRCSAFGCFEQDRREVGSAEPGTEQLEDFGSVFREEAFKRWMTARTHLRILRTHGTDRLAQFPERGVARR